MIGKFLFGTIFTDSQSEIYFFTLWAFAYCSLQASSDWRWLAVDGVSAVLLSERMEIWGVNASLSKPAANNTALIWQKEASDKSDISRKRAKCVCHLHWCQWNIMMSYLTYLLVGWVFLHEIWPGRRAHYVNYENINNSNLDGTCMSLASFCQSRAE